MQVDLNILDSYVEQGLLDAQVHPIENLRIYDYSRKCQFSKAWDAVTLACRGLVVDFEGTVIARPIPKFFNEEELPKEYIPWHLGCKAYPKLDGSMFILFNYRGMWLGSTRGSFTSDQAKEAMKIFKEKYSFVDLPKNYTYCFEVIYPENKIVVDYKGLRDIILLAAINTETGEELEVETLSDRLNVVRALPVNVTDSAFVKGLIKDDEEGYVLKFSNNFRIKIKGERYKELHKLVFNISERMVWEYLSSGKEIDYSVLPEEYIKWVKDVETRLLSDFEFLGSYALRTLQEHVFLRDRKSLAIHLLEEHGDIADLVFMLADEKDITKEIWKRLYPEHRLARCQS